MSNTKGKNTTGKIQNNKTETPKNSSIKTPTNQQDKNTLTNEKYLFLCLSH
jgi:hypothetical protein